MNCKTLTLFTSESCNLQCKYCDMASHINAQAHKDEAKKVKESLVNGQYLETIKIAYQRLSLNVNDLVSIDLWGQEPTLTLDEFGVMFIELYNMFPNWEHLFFSTNGVNNINKIIDLIKLINQTIVKDFTLSIQFSFDGYEQTLLHRGINGNTVINNIVSFLEELNKITLNKLSIIISPHNVIDQETFTLFAKNDSVTEQKLYKYLKDFQDLYYLFTITNTNQKVKITTFGAGLETPLNGSVSDGKNLAKFYQQCEKVGKNLTIKNWQQLPNQISKRIKYDNNFILESLASIVQDKFIYYPNYLQKMKDLSLKLFCGFNYSSLKIRYDGTLLYCQNALYALDENGLDNIDNRIQYNKKNKNFYPNIFTSTEQQLNNYFNEVSIIHEETFYAAFMQVMTLLTLLLKENQIDLKYKDFSNFIKCAYYITFAIPCPHNAIMYTGRCYGSYLGWIRLLCNGFLDIVWRNEEKKYDYK